MGAAKWCTAIGSVILGLFGIGHGTRLKQIQAMLDASAVKTPLDVILKACWLIFSVEMVMVAIIAFVASRMERGASLVLLCAAINAANGVLVYHYLGPFIGLYASVVVAALYLIGGWLQSAQTKAQAA